MKNSLWVEKYRPNKIEDCILKKETEKIFKSFKRKKDISNMIFTGSSGVGKTTAARALCDELEVDYIFINGSEDNGIDVLRTKMRDFCSTVSLTGGRKVVIVDEADYLNPNSFQPAFRGFIEEFSECRFIFTCNFENKILPALHSRLTRVSFDFSAEEKKDVFVNFCKRLASILDNEGVDYSKPAVKELVKKYFPDFRKVISEAQKYSQSGKIDAGILETTSNEEYGEVIECLRKKDFKNMRKWVSENVDKDIHIYKKMFTLMHEFVTPESIPQMVLLLAEYQYKHAFVIDKEINFTAMFTEIMSECQFKGE